MKRKKVECDNQIMDNIILNDVSVFFGKENLIVFEIGNEVASDISEFIAILTKNIKYDNEIWNTVIDKKLLNNISTVKTLYWLSGGDVEWNNGNHYNRPWSIYNVYFYKKYNRLVKNILKKSKTYGDVRDYFNEYLNLPILYDFALSQNMIK